METKNKICPNCGNEMIYLPKGICEDCGISCPIEYLWICFKCGKEIEEGEED